MNPQILLFSTALLLFVGNISITSAYKQYALQSENFDEPNDHNSNNYLLPTIQIELLDQDSKFFVHSPYFSSTINRQHRNFGEIPLSSSVRFSDEKIIYWKSTDYYASSKYENQFPLRLRLTCEAPFISKWNVVSNSGNGKRRNSYMKYDINQFSRDDEDPLHPPKLNADLTTIPGATAKGIYFNLTELHINSFESEFQSGFIDCVHRLNDSMKSRLYIFQRFGSDSSKIEGQSFIDGQGKSLDVSQDTVIPCKVHDPSVTPTLLCTNQSAWTTVTDLFSYDWKAGFTSKDPNMLYKDGEKFQCVLEQSNSNQLPSVTYTFFVPELSDRQLNLAQKEGGNKRLKQKPITLDQYLVKEGDSFKFICKLGNLRQPKDYYINITQNINRVGLEQIQLESCTSPDYCFPTRNSGTSSGLHNIKNCSIILDSSECELQLPMRNLNSDEDEDEDKDRNIEIQGRLSCDAMNSVKPITATEYYFTGLMGHVYLLSQSAPLEEIVQLKIKQFDDPNKVTFTLACEAVRFITSPSFKFSISFINGTRKLLTSRDYAEVASVEEWNRRVALNEWIRRKVVKVTISGDYKRKIRGISCHVPLFNSTQWLEVTENITISNDDAESIVDVATSNITVMACIAVALIILLLLILWCIKRLCTIEFCCCPPDQTAVVHCESVSSQELKNIKQSIKIQRSIPPKYWISRNDITPNETKCLGEGQFSRLCQGYLKQRYYRRNSVNLKMNKVAGDPIQIEALLNDAQIRALLEEQQRHHNIVSFHGVFIDCSGGKVYIAMEPEHTGSIRDYMIMQNLGREKLLNISPAKRVQNFITWLRGVANGMEFLHGLRVIHGNLAAENILMFPNNSVKITGFSHAQQLNPTSTYFVKKRSWSWEHSGWKWMPMESLRYMEFSKESDIWSFGVTMWEIFSLGASPYLEQGYFQFSLNFALRLEQGLRLNRPQMTPSIIHKRMNECWSRYGRDRPTFASLNYMFDGMLTELRYETV